MSIEVFRFTEDDWEVVSNPRRYFLKVQRAPQSHHIGPVMVLETEPNSPNSKVADVDIFLAGGLAIESTYRFDGEVRYTT